MLKGSKCDAKIIPKVVPKSQITLCVCVVVHGVVAILVWGKISRHQRAVFKLKDNALQTE